MGTESWVLAGDARSEAAALSSACHGAGRAMSRHAAARAWTGAGIQKELAARGIIVKSPSRRGIAEEAPAPGRPAHADDLHQSVSAPGARVDLCHGPACYRSARFHQLRPLHSGIT
jgi:hypothetical protein